MQPAKDSQVVSVTVKSAVLKQANRYAKQRGMDLQELIQKALPSLQVRYRTFLRTDIIGIRILHSVDRVYLEVTITENATPELRDQKVMRIDLGFISNSQEPMFSVEKSVFENARLFAEELDPYSIINCTPIFSPDSEQMINNMYNLSDE